MNKQQYLQELDTALRGKKVQDIEEILLEYEQHFLLKAADGFAEEEIANNLEKPAVIAGQFSAIEQPGTSHGSGGKAILAIGLGIADFFACIGFVLLAGWVIVIGAFAVAATALGGVLVTGTNVAGLIPPMPYFAELILGISMVALGVLSLIGTIYLYLYMAQWIKSYVRWTKNTLHGGVYPPLSKNPDIGNRFKRRLRSTAIVSLAVFGILFVAGTIALFAYTGFKPFWHELSWFV